jgi:hypothetical protein
VKVVRGVASTARLADAARAARATGVVRDGGEDDDEDGDDFLSAAEPADCRARVVDAIVFCDMLMFPNLRRNDLRSNAGMPAVVAGMYLCVSTRVEIDVLPITGLNPNANVMHRDYDQHELASHQ